MRPDPFELDRSHLSHARLKNGFLTAIAYCPEDSSREDRKCKFLEAMSGDGERRDQLHRAFRRWPGLADDIRSFLHHLPTRYGFVLSEVFRQELVGVDLALSGISDFVSRFLEDETSKEDLDDFWRAMDTVTGFLTRLGTQRSLYVVDFDPGLKGGS